MEAQAVTAYRDNFGTIVRKPKRLPIAVPRWATRLMLFAGYAFYPAILIAIAAIVWWAVSNA